MRFHVMIDLRTGEPRVVARDGSTYAPEEIDAARRRADAGDPVAIAFLDRVRMRDDTSPEDAMREMLEHCTDCRQTAKHLLKPGR